MSTDARKFTMAGSPSVHRVIPDLPNAMDHPFTWYNVTIILLSDNGRWVDRAYRRLRPHFVSSLEDAKRVHKLYMEMNNAK